MCRLSILRELTLSLLNPVRVVSLYTWDFSDLTIHTKKKKKKTFLKRFTKWKFRSAHRITRIKFQHKKNDYTGHLTQAAYYF